jgi:hypothetical protein
MNRMNATIIEFVIVKRGSPISGRPPKLVVVYNSIAKQATVSMPYVERMNFIFRFFHLQFYEMIHGKRA